MSLNSIPAVTVQDGALGAIVESTSTRKRVYSAWILIGLALQAIVAGIIAGTASFAAVAALGWPLLVSVAAAILGAVAGAYAALTPQVATLARANTSSTTSTPATSTTGATLPITYALPTAQMSPSDVASLVVNQVAPVDVPAPTTGD
ncbi:MAG: hypothetical protein J0I33_07820 [Microbacterium ginsengisoli]|jgi:hypothetical protein|uniref:hypothetical protein n=1 Tax=Microbacterium TaxID=33882 RepID=UPI0006FB55C2|nr:MULTISPECIES: hypothetical protein [unclassified Microbacterium]KQR97704.1 hypothetical protein ASF93_13325 [Microbacterium sp. Leaf347]KQS01728.1 hypothetical protein ASG00_09850 [Microbacterium sp. Leaf351]MBN9198531.1 hypothetical protein [Microbacterium ginsengisoli]OJU78085.1 MAG: hypothetical protein BGO15_02475 [Microbacterium sp. 71-23]